MKFEIQLNLNERSKYVGVWFLVHSALIMQNMNFFNIKGNHGKNYFFSESANPSQVFGILYIRDKWKFNYILLYSLYFA